MENPFKDSEDKLLFAKALDRLNFAEKRGASAFTDFIDPMRCEMFLQILQKKSLQGVEVTASGGHANAERKMIGFLAAAENNAEDCTFPITPLTFTYNAKFCTAPTHRDYLGAVLGLGLERGKIGDIIMHEAAATMYVSSDVAEYICENLQQAGRTAIKGKIGEAPQTAEPQGTQKRITVPSLRTDAVISSAFNISRREATALIDSEKVFVNWKPAKKTQLIAPADTVTIRGKGRVIINEQVGSTKKDRLVLVITKY
ncbi:MAG: YlmH/Sll1252 family protein [Defluviitaleaceae bacterium]|nr:YlmH/Sll1252 family protein [Defluviitaleaceae bacterium]MCL2262476.1 YlmH/Sll1252 family protein [Defluviitaleaceae bacterium]